MNIQGNTESGGSGDNRHAWLPSLPDKEFPVCSFSMPIAPVNSCPVVKQPPAKKRPSKPAPSPIKCYNDNLILKAAVGNRGEERLLTIPETTPNTMQIIASVNGRKITATTKLTAGPCSGHLKKVLTLYGTTATSKNDQELVFTAGCHENYTLSPIPLTNLDNIWPSPAKIKEFMVITSTCDAPREYVATLQVYPDLQWEANIGFNFGEKETTNKLTARTISKEVTKYRGWEAGLSVTSGGTKYAITAEALKETETMTKKVYKTFAMAKEMAGLLKRVTEVDVSLQFPNFTLKGSWGYEQHPKQLTVLMGYSVTLAMDPLIGIEFRVDVLNQLIKSLNTVAPGAAEILLRVKKAAEKKEIVKTKCELFASGQITGELQFKHQVNTEASGSVEGRIKIGIEANLEFSTDSFWIETKAGLKGGAESGISGKLTAAGDDTGPYWQGSITWDGIIFKGAVYVSADLKIVSIETDGSKEYLLLEPKTWDYQKHYFLPSQ